MPELGVFLGAIQNTAYGFTTPARWDFTLGGNITGITSVVPEVDPSTGAPTGKIYVGGDFISYNGVSANGIIRLNSDGTRDTNFNTGLEDSSTVYTICQASGSDKIYVGGNFNTYFNNTTRRIVRLNSDGTRDTTFNLGTGFNNVVNTICQASGSDKIYVGGYFTTYSGSGANRIARLNPNGTRDTTFNLGTGFNNVVNTICQASGSDKIYVGGGFLTYSGSSNSSYIIKLNSNGSVDSNFISRFGGGGSSVAVVNTICQASGSDKIYVGGNFTSHTASNSANPTSPPYIRRIVRLNSDGTRDTSFNIGNTSNSNNSGFDTNVNYIIQSADNTGDIYVGGNFTTYSGSSDRNKIIRITSGGSINTNPVYSFGTGIGVDGVVISLATSGSNGLYIGGNFNSFNGTSSLNHFIKLISQ